MVLDKLLVPGRPTNLYNGRGKGLLRLQLVRMGVVWTFSLSRVYFTSSLGDGRYRLEYSRKGPLSPQTTNLPNHLFVFQY